MKRLFLLSLMVPLVLFSSGCRRVEPRAKQGAALLPPSSAPPPAATSANPAAPAGGLAARLPCVATPRHKFHLRPQETVKSEGVPLPAGARVELLAQSELGRAGSRLFQGRIQETGQTGYLFVGAGELDAGCGFAWEDDPRADRTPNQPLSPAASRCIVKGPVPTREQLIRPSCTPDKDAEKRPRIEVFAELDLNQDATQDQLLLEIDRFETFWIATHTPAGWVAYAVEAGSGDADGPQVSWVKPPVVTADGVYAVVSMRREYDEAEKYNVQTYTLFRARAGGALFQVFKGDVEGGARGEVSWRFQDVGGGSLELLGSSGRLQRLRWDRNVSRLIPQRITVKSLSHVEKPPAPAVANSPAPSPCVAFLAANDAKLRRFFRRCSNGKQLYDEGRGEADFLQANPHLGNQTSETRERTPRDCQEIAGGYIGLRIRGIQAPEEECRSDGCSGEDCVQRLSSLNIQKTLVVEVNGQHFEIHKRKVARRESLATASGFELQELSDTYADPDDSRRLRLLRSRDLDGDGVPEIITQQDIHEDCDRPYSDLRIWKIQGRYLVPYAHEPKAEILEIKDVDQDGRLDLISRGAYDAFRNECVIDEEAGPPIFVHHGLPDGSFSEDDEVARAALRSYCPTRPTQLPAWTSKSHAELDTFIQEILCARAWKTSAAELLRKLGKQCRTWSNDELACQEAGYQQGLCPAWIKKFIEVQPRVQLP